MNAATLVQKRGNYCNGPGLGRRFADSDNLSLPEVIAQKIVDDLEAALEQFRLIAGDLGGATSEVS